MRPVSKAFQKLWHWNGSPRIESLRLRKVRRGFALIGFARPRSPGVPEPRPMKSRLFAAASIAALMLGLAACASTDMTAADQTVAGMDVAPTAGAGAVVVPPLGFQERTLPNGLRVFTARDTATSNVTVQVWYRVGSKDDPQDRSGFAHLFEHLMFKATENFPDETFDRLTEDVGGNNNAFTSDDVTAYHETVPANHLERLIFAEADRLVTALVPVARESGDPQVVVPGLAVAALVTWMQGDGEQAVELVAELEKLTRSSTGWRSTCHSTRLGGSSAIAVSYRTRHVITSRRGGSISST